MVLSTPGVDGLSEAVRVLREWQYDGAPMQLHPGDLGWHWRFGAEATAMAVRTWSRDGQILAVGLLDGPGLLRLAIAPEAQHDEGLAQQMVAAPGCPEIPIVGKVGVMPGNTSKRYPPELKERAVRMVAEIREDHDSEWAAMAKVAELLGVTTPETVRK